METKIFQSGSKMDDEAFFTEMVLRGMLDEQVAGQVIFMNKKKKVTEVLGDIVIKPYPAQRTNMYKPSSAVRKEHNLKSAYYGSEEKIIETLYVTLFGDKSATFETVFNKWVEEREKDPDVSPTTVRHDKEYFAKYIKGTELASKKLRDINDEDLGKFFKSITEGRVMKKKSFDNVKSCLNIFFDSEIVKKYRTGLNNPARAHKASNYKTRPYDNSKKVYTADERKQIMSYLIQQGTVYDLALALMFCLGCRIGEIKALHWADFNFQLRTVFIHRSVITNGNSQNQQIEVPWTKNGKKEGNRTIVLNDTALYILELIKELKVSDDLLFVGETGNHLLTEEANRHLKVACEALGINYFSSHKIRATVATELLRNGMDMITAMYTFGWADKNTIESYIRTGRTTAAQQIAFSAMNIELKDEENAEEDLEPDLT